MTFNEFPWISIFSLGRDFNSIVYSVHGYSTNGNLS